MDNQVGEKGEKLSINSILFQNHQTVLVYLFIICSRIVRALYPRYEAWKGGPQTCPEGGLDANDVHEKHPLQSSLSFPWSGNFFGYFTHP